MFFGQAAGMGGRSRGRPAVRRGDDLRFDLRLSFTEAAFGVERELSFDRLDPCPDCAATGALKGTQPSTCPDCNGSGQLRRLTRTILGQMMNQQTCPRCHGEGKVIASACQTCRGSGLKEARIKRQVKIPAGVDHGSQIRLGGEGEAGLRGGPHGDLYIVLHVEPHEHFLRRDQDVLYELPISFAQAALGDELLIPTLDGSAKLTVPAGTQHGRTFRLRGKGIPHVRSGARGDQLVSVKVVTPTELTPAQRKAFEALGDRTGLPHPEGRGLFDKVKEAFKG
jgi:molecular chaperone DnaJ